MEHSLKEVRKIFHQDKNEILRKYSSTGAGIGKEQGNYVIVVYIDLKSKLPKGDLYWKKIPLKFEHVDEIKLQ
jgi:hypothetical protein